MTSVREALSSDEMPNTLFAPPAAAKQSWESRIRRLVATNGHVIATTLTSFGVFAIFAVQGIFLARLLGPVMRAEYGTIVFYCQTLTYIGLLGTMLSIASYAAKHPGGLPNLRRVAIGLAVLTGVGTALAVAVLAFTALPTAKRYLAPMCIVCGLLLPFEHMRLMLLAVDHGSGNFPKYNRNILVGAISLPTMLGLIWVSGSHSLHLVVLATILAPVCGLIYRFRSEGMGIVGPRAVPPARTLLVKGIPYALAQTATDLFNRLDAFLILWMASLKEQGYYTAAVSAASLMLVAPTALALFSFKSSARSNQPASVKQVATAGIAVVVIQLITSLSLLVMIEPLVVFVFGSSFRGAVPYAKLLLTAQAIGGLTYVAGGYLRGRGKSSLELRTRVLAAGVIVAVALALYGRLGDLSIPIGAVCGQAICAVLLCWSVIADARLRSDEAAEALTGA